MVRLFVFTLLLIVSIQANAAGERQVIGGDIMYSTNAEANDEVTAQFLAQQAAVKLLVTECGLPHREIKIWKSSSQPAGSAFWAKATAGIPFESCEEGKKAKGKDRDRLSNPDIVKSQATYSKYLEKNLGVAKDEEEKPVEMVTPEQLEAVNKRLDDMNDQLSEKPQGSKLLILRQNASTGETQTESEAHREDGCVKGIASLRKEAKFAEENGAPKRAKKLREYAAHVEKTCFK